MKNTVSTEPTHTNIARVLDLLAETPRKLERLSAGLADEPLLVDIHPERQWGMLLRYDRLDFGDLLAYFRLRRTVLLRALTALREEQWLRTIR